MIFRQRDDDGFGRSSVLGMLLSPFRAIGRSVGELLERDDSMHVDRSMISRVVGFLTLPFRVFGGFLVFMVQAWSQSRPGFAFLKSLPAIIGMGGFFFSFLVADLVLTEARQIGSTSGYLAYQLEVSPEYPGYALIFAQKLVELKADDPRHMYELGLAYERVGNYPKAVDVMSSIAFDDHAGDFPMAHVWRSQYLLRGKNVELDQETREELARKQLGFAVEIDPQNQFANFELSKLFVTEANRLEKGSADYNANMESAIEKLSTVVAGNLTGLHLLAVPRLVELELEMGLEDRARRRLDAEINLLKKIARKRPEIYEIWLAMIKCTVLLKDYDQATDIVKEGIELVDDEETKRKIFQLGAQIYDQKSNDFTDMSDRDQYRDRLNSLCEAIRLNRINRSVYLKLLDFIGERKPDQITGGAADDPLELNPPTDTRLDFSEADESWLSDSIVGCPVPGVVHALLGMRKISKGNVREGEKHWRIAEQQFGFTQLVINNLIDVAAKERPDEFSNMLDMITLGIELFPDQPVFYQTRGVYLMNQGRLDEAVEDLVYASEKIPQMVTLHKIIANCYEKLGNEEKVLEHTRLLEEKLGQLDTKNRRQVEAAINRLQ